MKSTMNLLINNKSKFGPLYCSFNFKTTVRNKYIQTTFNYRDNYIQTRINNTIYENCLLF